MRRVVTALGAVLALAAATACGDEDAVPTLDGTETAPAPAAETVFAQAMSRISPDALAEGTLIRFGQTAQLLALGAADERWLEIAATGNRLLPVESSASAIGVDPDGATYAVEVSDGPTRVSLLVGGQDPEAITVAATKAGYTGDVVLTQEADSANPVTLAVQQIKPLEDDVVLGGGAADVGWVDAGSLFADPEVAPVAACLGDVLAAMIAERDGGLIGIGVREEAAEIQSVVCLPGGADAASAAADAFDGPEFADRLDVIATDVVEADYAKVLVQHAPGESAALMMMAASQQALPGA
ncbi:hypothetical protein [Cumulibacter soli]|uniref:hypothetical protein n=1 Tax=Cumulibacter soli TaxID=2546344 RepID=UPI0010680B87|nr:hypothetical protein [Cumulibacter soli]